MRFAPSFQTRTIQKSDITRDRRKMRESLDPEILNAICKLGYANEEVKVGVNREGNHLQSLYKKLLVEKKKSGKVQVQNRIPKRVNQREMLQMQ